jgi:hypothetical protein
MSYGPKTIIINVIVHLHRGHAPQFRNYCFNYNQIPPSMAIVFRWAFNYRRSDVNVNLRRQRGVIWGVKGELHIPLA